MGHRRLADAQAIGGAGEALQLGHQGEDFQLGKGHEYLLILR